MGHYCRICGRTRANEKFSGKGRKKHVCKDCAKKSGNKAKSNQKGVSSDYEAETFLSELFLEEDHISEKEFYDEDRFSELDWFIREGLRIVQEEMELEGTDPNREVDIDDDIPF